MVIFVIYISAFSIFISSAEGKRRSRTQAKRKQHALNQRSPAEGKGKGQKPQKQHALKGQKLLAQGSALGINDIQLTPCKGKSFKIMAQSLSKIYIHLIFHIKSTSPKIRENDLGRLHQYIGKLVKTSGCTEIKAGGIGDHVHVLFILSKDVTISQIVEEIKRNSSRWIKDLDPGYYHFFAWQGGYAAYSISQSVVDKTLQYIDNQKEHHTKHSFAEEYRAFLELYNVEYNEKFVFRD